MDKWNTWYKHLNADTPTSFLYGDTVTYEKGYTFLKDCNKVEDWGCGAGGFKRFFKDNSSPEYIGVDGSITPFANIKADLTTYVSSVEGIYMRHILEHNYEWKSVLNNACKSFTSKMCLVLFTPFTEITKEIAHNKKHGVDVPDMAFSKEDICSVLTQNNISYSIETLTTNTGYGVEHLFYLTK